MAIESARPRIQRAFSPALRRQEHGVRVRGRRRCRGAERRALKRSFKALAAGPAPEPNALELREPVPPKGWRIQLVDKPDRQQTQLLFGHPAVRATDPDFLPLTLGLTAFGGHAMNATMMSEIRRKRGLAYGAYLTLGQRRGTGAAIGWVFSASDKTVTTLKLVLRLYVAFMDKGLSADDVAFFKRFLIGSHASDMDVPEQRLAARVSAEVAGCRRTSSTPIPNASTR